MLAAQDIQKYTELVMRGLDLKNKINEDIKYLLANEYGPECREDFINCFDRSCEAYENEIEVEKLELEKSKMMINARMKEADAVE